AVLAAQVAVEVALLPAVPLRLADGAGIDPQLGQCLQHGLGAERPDDDGELTHFLVRLNAIGDDRPRPQRLTADSILCLGKAPVRGGERCCGDWAYWRWSVCCPGRRWRRPAEGAAPARRRRQLPPGGRRSSSWSPGLPAGRRALALSYSGYSTRSIQ